MNILVDAARPFGLLICLGLTAWGGFMAPALAQSSATPGPLPRSRSEAVDARAAVPPLRYRSVFEGYRPHLPQEPRHWRQANDTVREAGGWRAYAREAEAAARTPDAASAPDGRNTLPKPVPQHHAH